MSKFTCNQCDHTTVLSVVGAICPNYPGCLGVMFRRHDVPDEGQMLKQPGWTYDPDIATFRDGQGRPVRRIKDSRG